MTESFSEQLDGMHLPPLGKAPEFDVEEKAHSEEAASVEYLRIDSDPQLAPAFYDLVDYTKKFQSRYGIPTSAIDPESVHVLTADNMGYVAGLLKLQEDNGAVYDSRADVMYVRAPEQRDSVISLVLFNYAVSHELGHKLTSGLSRVYRPSDNSHILREGIADDFARGYMHGVYLPNYAPTVDEVIAHQFGQGQRPYEFEGVTLEREDILTIDPATLYATGFSRIFETKIVHELESRLGAEAYAEIMREAAGPDVLAVRQLIIAQCGIETWDLLTTNPSNLSPVEVLRELQK